jgi:hypothetical protein
MIFLTAGAEKSITMLIHRGAWGRGATKKKKNGEKVARLKEMSYICSQKG